jgi:uncharacterized membrane protein
MPLAAPLADAAGAGAAASSPLAPLSAAQQVILFVISLFAFVVLDGIWIGFVAKDFYAQHLGPSGVLRPDVDLVAGLLSWIAIVAALFIFVLPTTAGYRSATRSLSRGALMGLCLYSTVDFTNAALVRGWSMTVASVDVAWGTTACAVSALVQNRLYAALAEAAAR